ncbi:MAG: hypothetical protein EPO08_15690 [Rhodospirillaceae bacterium]|nr:MAG: hypothetical protein EPO08_15690 [Rhodospirillaceae bacterium]
MIELYVDGKYRSFWLNAPADFPKIGGDYFPLPANVANVLETDNHVTGDFRVCPLEAVKVDQDSQLACIESASNILVEQTEKTCWGEIGEKRASAYADECFKALRNWNAAPCNVYTLSCRQVAEGVKAECTKFAKIFPDMIPALCKEDPVKRLQHTESPIPPPAP